jgi:hypothetical protein
VGKGARENERKAKDNKRKEKEYILLLLDGLRAFWFGYFFNLQKANGL